MVVCAFAIGGCGIYVISMPKKKQKEKRRALTKLREITGEFIFIRIWQPSSVNSDLPILPTVHPLFKFTIGIYKKRIIFIFALALCEEALIKNFL